VTVPIFKETVSGGRLPDEGTFRAIGFSGAGDGRRVDRLRRPQLSSASRLQQQLPTPGLRHGSGSASGRRRTGDDCDAPGNFLSRDGIRRSAEDLRRASHRESTIRRTNDPRHRSAQSASKSRPKAARRLLVWAGNASVSLNCECRPLRAIIDGVALSPVFVSLSASPPWPVLTPARTTLPRPVARS
jgi:hypothetical protein